MRIVPVRCKPFCIFHDNIRTRRDREAGQFVEHVGENHQVDAVRERHVPGEVISASRGGFIVTWGLVVATLRGKSTKRLDVLF